MRGKSHFQQEAKNSFWGRFLYSLFLIVVFFFLVACRSKKEGSSRSDIKPAEMKIFIVPAEGETVTDLDQSLTLFFPEPVQAEDFSFTMQPDPGGWKPVWDASRKKVRLDHANPFTPLKEYRVKVSVKGRPSLNSGFKTAAADPSSLLESDLAKGTITADQASRFRVMRIFKPGAVPEKYRYSKAPRSGTWDVLQAANQLAKLKPETIKELTPYFVRPDHPASVFYKRLFEETPASSVSVFSLVPAAYAAESFVQEVYHTETGMDVVISGPRSLADKVRSARRSVEEYKMYEKFERLLHRKTFDYGDRKLYIYISPYLAEMEAPGGGSFEPQGVCMTTDPAYVPNAGLNLDRHMALILISARQVDDDAELADVIAHEMFHAFQYAFSRLEERWLVEGSAMWAEDFIEPEWNFEQVTLDGATFNPKASAHNIITEKVSDNAYGMYLFFYYLTKVRSGGGDFIMRRIWDNCEAARTHTLSSVQAAVGGDFKDVIKEYALFTLDKEEYEGKFPDTVGLYGGQNPLQLAETHKFRKDWRIKEDGNIEAFAFVVDGMGITYLEVTNEAVGYAAPTIRFDLKEFTDKDPMAIQAIVKFRDGKSVKEDWTGLEERVFCLASKRDNFTSIYIAVSWSEENKDGEIFLLDIQPAPDMECLSGQMRITMSIKGQEQVKYARRQPGDSRDRSLDTRWDREARFDLDLVPQRPEISAEGEGLIKALPEKIQGRTRAEMQRPEGFFDEHTQCQVYVFRVKSCRVGSFQGSKNQSGTETINDAFGLQYHVERQYDETWSSGGLSEETKEWLKDKSLAVRVYVDPKSNRIQWVEPQGPIGVQGEGKSYSKAQGRQRIETYPTNTYREISRSDSKDLAEDMMVLHVSKHDKDLPLNPDWKAQQGGAGQANGKGEYKRILDKDSTDDEGGKTTIRGEERHSIKWELSVEINPKK